MPFTLPKLPYSLEALEPVISRELLDLHYNKHHAAYVKGLNDAMTKLEEAQKNNQLETIILCQKLIEFNGGGHWNHSFFWESLAPTAQGGGKAPKGDLAKAIQSSFGSLEKLIEIMNQETGAIQGSGWGWLVFNPQSHTLAITTTHNHKLPQKKKLQPLLCIDAWEHAYYLQYKNVRADFVKAIWNVVNWSKVEERLMQVT